MNTPSQDSLIGKYYLETDGNLADVARSMIVMETTGGWDGPGEEPDLFRQATGALLEVQEDAPGRGTVTVAFPLVNFNLEDSAFASMWLSMIGGGTHALLSYRKSRLLDFDLPEGALASFPGPGFGIEGTRDLLDLPPGLPVIGTIVKPTAGLTVEQVADLCYRMALGGVRFIKDDEKMMGPAYCPLRERVEAIVDALKRAQDATGQNVIYAPHITTSPWNLQRYASTAIDAGATALMVNIFAGGFQALEALRLEFPVPIYAHCGGKEAFGREPGQGVSPEVVGKFARLLGGDYFRTGTLGGYLVGGERTELDSLTRALTTPMPGIRPAVPVLSGGLKPANLAENLRAFGGDVLALAGTGLTRHPKGIAFAVEEMLRIAGEVCGA